MAASTSTSPVIAEQHRIERIVSGVKAGDTAVINGSPVVAVSLATADLVERYTKAASRCRSLCAAGRYDDCLIAQDEMRECRRQLDEAGMLHLIEAA